MLADAASKRYPYAMPKPSRKLVRWTLPDLLASRRWSGNDLAEHANLSRQTAYKLLREMPTRIDTATLAKLCEVFDCQPGDLLVYKR